VIIDFVILFLFLVPVAALLWRMVVSKSRSWPLRIGGAAAAMAGTVGAVIVYDDLQTFEFSDWRGDAALAAAVSASVYLLLWALRHRTNQRHRTVSLIAAAIGFVPFIATLSVALLYREQP
jgi:hypothetical protein